MIHSSECISLCYQVRPMCVEQNVYVLPEMWYMWRGKKIGWYEDAGIMHACDAQITFFVELFVRYCYECFHCQ